MDQSTRNSERLTAILSTLVAVAILAMGVTAQQVRSARPDELSYLESDLRFQLEAAYRLNPKEGQSRLDQLESVLATWREAPRTEADRRLLSTWLLEATIRSMPGSLEELPPSPQFGAREPTPERSAPPLVEAEPAPPAPETNSEHADIVEPLHAPFVAGLTPDLAPPQAYTAASPTPDLAPTPVEHKLVSVPAQKPVADPKPQAPAVEINLTELSARIAGYHQGLSELESTLYAEERPQVDRLTSQIGLLESLAKDYQFVQLYYDALAADERQTVEAPRSLGPLLTALRKHVDRLLSDADGDFLGEFDADLSNKVTDLRNQLNAIASRVN